MLVELRIIPLGPGADWSDQAAEVLRIVDASGLAYQLTPSRRRSAARSGGPSIRARSGNRAWWAGA